MVKKKIYLTIITSLLFVSYSCNFINSKEQLGIKQEKIIQTNITGNVDLSSFIKKEGFSTKATTQDIISSAAITFSYPSDYYKQNLANQIISTTVTNENGNFSINMPEGFYPIIDQIYVLDATKRKDGIGNNKLTLRTLVKYNGFKWESISKDKIVINDKTTTLSILAKNNLVLGESIINRITMENGISKLPNSIIDQTTEPITNINSLLLDKTNSLVNSALSNNFDPLETVFVKNNSIVFVKNPNELTALSGCVNDCIKNLNVKKVSKNSSIGIETPAESLDACVGELATCPKALNPSIASSENKLIVVWQELQADKTYDIMGKLYSISKINLALQPLKTRITSISDKFKINTITAGDQTRPDVSMDENGNFVVAWQSHKDRAFSDIFVRKFMQNGTPLSYLSERINNPRDNNGNIIPSNDPTEEFKVNSFSISKINGLNSKPKVSMNGSGSFAVTWQSNKADINGYDIFASIFKDNYVQYYNEFKVNTNSLNNQINPSVAFLFSRLLFTWESSRITNNSDIYYKEYKINLDGTNKELPKDKFGNYFPDEDIKINDNTSDINIKPSVSIYDNFNTFSWQTISSNKNSPKLDIHIKRIKLKTIFDIDSSLVETRRVKFQEEKLSNYLFAYLGNFHTTDSGNIDPITGELIISNSSQYYDVISYDIFNSGNKYEPFLSSSFLLFKGEHTSGNIIKSEYGNITLPVKHFYRDGTYIEQNSFNSNLNGLAKLTIQDNSDKNLHLLNIINYEKPISENTTQDIPFFYENNTNINKILSGNISNYRMSVSNIYKFDDYGNKAIEYRTPYMVWQNTVDDSIDKPGIYLTGIYSDNIKEIKVD
ncbi:MAG: hypothetical protein U0457_19775 [Candidatus Sericytochromatia bacterium]